MGDENVSTGQAERFAQSWQEGTYGARGESPTQGTTPLLEGFITQLKKHATLTGSLPQVLEGGAGSGDHAIRLVQEGFVVVANEYSEVAATRIRLNGNTHLSQCDKTKLQVARGDVLEYLERQKSMNLDGFYANSVLHTFSPEERLALYRAIHRVQPEGGLVAVSFKADGDGVQRQGKVQEETEAGKIVQDNLGISRLFVQNPRPLIEELTRAGYRHLETFEWSVQRYIAVQTYDSGARKFIGFLAQKE